jgi:hypothetical protein
VRGALRRDLRKLGSTDLGGSTRRPAVEGIRYRNDDIRSEYACQLYHTIELMGMVLDAE